MSRKIDPRIVRTRKLFKEALISLLEDNEDTRKLTVQNIADRAQLNRATFYLHYRDIEDLMEQMIGEILEDMYDTIAPPSPDKREKGQTPPRSRLISFLEHIYAHSALFKVMLENHDFRQRMFELLLEIVTLWEKDRLERGKTFHVPNEIIASSTLGIVTWWLREDTPYSPNYLAKQIILMVTKK
ncbi:TetR/AcrR family transcriptional regulator [Robertmurraya massiliosenegalensis]|uniref:TetR/AcrR family transcriptional regulator n=1 Tax=Robertmurraya massiliosenegalensis TaxID=1287657 RepID=UPI0002DD6EAD|nr:TetR/AcrR family transcriptional regulator [Robertmurraya massiliosenegalensis]